MIRALIAGAVFSVAILLTGTMDAEDADRDLAATCEMIESGAWPAEVEPNCGGEQ